MAYFSEDMSWILQLMLHTAYLNNRQEGTEFVAAEPEGKATAFKCPKENKVCHLVVYL